MPSTSSAVLPVSTLEDLRKQLDERAILPWTVDKVSNNESMKIEFHDGAHSIANFTVIVNAGLEFTVYVFHWPIPDDHIIYTGRKRSLKSSEDTKELLRLVENFNFCEGLPQDDNTKSVVVDPTWEQG